MIATNDYRSLNGTAVSPIGLGTVKFGRTSGLKYPNSFTIPDEKSLANLLSLARKLGINLLDTAPAYGTSEETLGRLLKGQRHNWFLSTKVGEYHQNGVSHYDFSTNKTRESVELSLKNLSTDVLDLVLVHSDGNDENIVNHTDIIETLATFKQQGLIRQIGFSSKSVSGGLAALEHVDVIMVSLNELDLSQADLIEAAQQRNKGVLVKKALDSGFSRDPNHALDFAVNYKGVTSVIVGTINPSHLESNVAHLTMG